jgi:DNA-binding XRE family transcriptional regulator
MGFYEDMEKSLLEAIEIEKGNVPLKERKNMLAPTYYVPDDDEAVIDKLIEIRKNENISQSELAKMTGSTQQAISRFEQKSHSPSLKMLVSITNALGYDIQFVKKYKI